MKVFVITCLIEDESTGYPTQSLLRNGVYKTLEEAQAEMTDYVNGWAKYNKVDEDCVLDTTIYDDNAKVEYDCGVESLQIIDCELPD